MACLARLIRCAIVASGTPNAAAICAVDRPPTARRVSAIWLGADRSGWQQPNSSASESSRSAVSASAAGPSNSDGGIASAICSSRTRRACSLRTWSVRRRAATVTSQPRGLAGIPSRGHCNAAASSASWLASSHRWNCPYPYRRTSAARTCGASSRSRASTSPRSVLTGARSHVWLGLVHDRPDFDRLGVRERHVRRDGQRALLALAIEQVEAGHVLLGLQVRAVGHGRLAVHPAHQPGLGRVRQPVGAEKLAGLPVLPVERILPGNGLRPLPGRDRRPLLLIPVDHEQVFHQNRGVNSSPLVGAKTPLPPFK